MSKIHLIVGPVGSGKSTFARQLCQEHNAVSLVLDEWMAQLFSADRPEEGTMEWYVERTERCIEQIWKVTEQLIATRTEVVLEIGLIQQPARQRLYRRVDAGGYPLTVYVLDAPRDVRWERVQRRNHERGDTFSMVVPSHIFEFASDLWEPLDEAECAGRDVRHIETGLQWRTHDS